MPGARSCAWAMSIIRTRFPPAGTILSGTPANTLHLIFPAGVRATEGAPPGAPHPALPDKRPVHRLLIDRVLIDTASIDMALIEDQGSGGAGHRPLRNRSFIPHRRAWATEPMGNNHATTTSTPMG